VKYLAIILVLYGAYYFANRHYQLHDALLYAKKHPEAKWAPALDYYVGTAYYLRDNHANSEEAFSQLLTDYPTCQYAPSAMVRLDDSAEENRHWDVARQALKQYVENYPDGRDIGIVRRKLELLNYNHP
jgi:TolA-binding protein